MVKRIERYAQTHIWHLTATLLCLVLTIYAHEYAVAQRVLRGYEATWGGEVFILPIYLIGYSVLKGERQ
jgi:hypothetical protein